MTLLSKKLVKYLELDRIVSVALLNKENNNLIDCNRSHVYSDNWMNMYFLNETSKRNIMSGSTKLSTHLSAIVAKYILSNPRNRQLLGIESSNITGRYESKFRKKFVSNVYLLKDLKHFRDSGVMLKRSL